MAVTGNTAYFGNGDYLEIVDFTNPANPNELSKILLPSPAQDIAVSGNYAYVADYEDGLYILHNDLITSVNDDKEEVPTNFVLGQNYPNPFNPTTVINYSISKRSFVTLKIYDILGREVSTLVNEEKPAGNYKVTFNGVNLPSGVYFYRLSATGKANNFVETKKLVLLK